MRHAIQPSSPLLAVAVALLAAALVAAPVAAKEWLEATPRRADRRWTRPAARRSSSGSSVTAPEPDGMHPVEGTPIYLKLIGRDGDTTRAAGAADRTPGHYTFRIAIPAGGARGVEIGIHGTSDLPIMVMDDPFTFGGDHRPDGPAGAAARHPTPRRPRRRVAAPAQHPSRAGARAGRPRRPASSRRWRSWVAAWPSCSAATPRGRAPTPRSA